MIVYVSVIWKVVNIGKRVGLCRQVDVIFILSVHSSAPYKLWHIMQLNLFRLLSHLRNGGHEDSLLKMCRDEIVLHDTLPCIQHSVYTTSSLFQSRLSNYWEGTARYGLIIKLKYCVRVFCIGVKAGWHLLCLYISVFWVKSKHF